ncbi:MAG: hypothetical protein ACXVFQ_13305 [Solirubrobacteraceae bacterium]
MATATRQARTTASRALVASESVSMEFLIVEDNGGDYHWTLLDRNGDSLARSPSLASYQDAKSAARVVLAGAESARLERRADTDGAVDMCARRDEAAAGDDTDAERSLDEGGSFSRKVARR